MIDDSHSPTLPVPVRTRRNGRRHTLIFTRELAHPPERVWTALTDPEELRAWAPFDAEDDLGRPGATTLHMAGSDGTGEYDRLPARVRLAERPHVLEYTWGDDVLRWELEPTARGTRLTLSHTMDDPDYLPRTAAGWHICLDVAERQMSGRGAGRIVGEAAKSHGWEVLHEAYGAQIAALGDR